MPKLWISILSSRRNRLLPKRLTPRSKEKYRRQRNKSSKTSNSWNQFYPWKVEVRMMSTKLFSNALPLWVHLWSSLCKRNTSKQKLELQRRNQCLMLSAEYLRVFTDATLGKMLSGHTLIFIMWLSIWKKNYHFRKNIVPPQSLCIFKNIFQTLSVEYIPKAIIDRVCSFERLN